jgi:hypothetical protein
MQRLELRQGKSTRIVDLDHQISQLLRVIFQLGIPPLPIQRFFVGVKRTGNQLWVTEGFILTASEIRPGDLGRLQFTAHQKLTN